MIPLIQNTAMALSVDAFSGSFSYEEKELDFKATGGETIFTFTRFYNSKISSAGIFGFGWKSDFENSLRIMNNNSIELNSHDEAEIKIFHKDPSKTAIYRCYNCGKFTSIKSENNEYVLEGRDGEYLKFDSEGKLREHILTPKYSLRFEYLENFTRRVIDTYGNQLQLELTPSTGKVSRVTTANNTELIYKYDGNLLVSVSNLKNKKAATYKYDLMGNLIEVFNWDGNSFSLTYDALRGQVRSVNDFSCEIFYDYGNSLKNNEIVEWTIERRAGSEGCKRKIFFQYFFRNKEEVKERKPYKLSKVLNDDKTNEIFFEYGKEVVALIQNSGESRLINRYDNEGRIVSVVLNGKVIEDSKYNTEGNLTERIYEGMKIVLTYDSNKKPRSLLVNAKKNILFVYSSDSKIIKILISENGRRNVLDLKNKNSKNDQNILNKKESDEIFALLKKVGIDVFN